MKIKKTTTLPGIKTSLAILFCILAGNASSQLYGEYAYLPSNYFLCSGSTGVNYPTRPGVVLAGNRLGSMSNHFTIIRTNQGGQLPGTGSWEFNKEYQILYNPVCSGTPVNPATSCYGVSVIETNSTTSSPALKYVMAGSFDGGVFYAELNAGGNVINTWFSALPAGAGQPGKPVICESNVSPGQYYVAGYMGALYAFRYVAGAAAPAVSRVYATSYCNPRAIIMSPFGNKDVTIVGETATQGSAWDAFFLQLNNASLAPTIYRNYDNNGSDQSFNTIDIATPNVGGQGFIIGGTIPGSWMLKVGPTGLLGGGYWSRLINVSGGFNTSNVAGVVERKNTANQFQYYGVLRSTSDVIVARLDALGNATGADQYRYLFLASNAIAVGLSKINTPGFPDEGLQIYAADRTTANQMYFGQACFSGQSGCSVVSSLGSVVNINPTITSPVMNISTSMQTCAAFNIIGTTPGMNIARCDVNAPFSGTAAVGGSNARLAAATGIEQAAADNKSISVYPNPAGSMISVSIKAGNGDDVIIELFDYLGRLVTSVPVKGAMQTTDINLGSLNIESGIYVISAKINGSTSTQKIIYTRE